MAGGSGSLKEIIGLRTGNWLKSQVDNYLTKTSVARPPDPGWFHPSEIGHTCDAYLAFSYLGVERREVVPAQRQRIFDNGHARDAAWKEYLELSGLSIVTNPADRKIVIPEEKIRGEVDDIVMNPLDRQVELVEIKTMHSKEWKELKEPLDRHKTQATLYMRALEILSTLFVYENKDTQEVKILRYRFDSSRWTTIKARLRRIIDLIENGFVPERTPVGNEQACRFFWMCHNADIVELRRAFIERQEEQKREQAQLEAMRKEAAR